MATIHVAAAALAAALSVSTLSIAGVFPDTADMPLPSMVQPIASDPEARVAPDGMASIEMCGDRAAMVADLQEQFREAPLATGLVDTSAVVEIFVSQEGTWTILATGTDGQSCVMAVGEGFEAAPRVIDTGA